MSWNMLKSLSHHLQLLCQNGCQFQIHYITPYYPLQLFLWKEHENNALFCHSAAQHLEHRFAAISQVLRAVLQQLLLRVLDKNKRVQEAPNGGFWKVGRSPVATFMLLFQYYDMSDNWMIWSPMDWKPLVHPPYPLVNKHSYWKWP